MKTQINKEVQEFLKASASVVTFPKEQYYFLPYWFKYGENGWEKLSWDKLPERVKEYVSEHRKDITNGKESLS